MTLHFDKLIDRYIPTDSGWQFHPENTALLPSSEIDGKLVIEAANPLGTDYKQLMYSNVAAGGNATVYYLDMITSKDSGELPTIERDLDASNAKAIRLKPNTTMIFKTNYPYNKDRLKKVLCRCKKSAGATTTLHVGVVGIEDKAYKRPDGTYGNDTFYEVTVSGEITESYTTYVGYILGTDSVENIVLVARPNNDPDYPAKLLDGTTDIALAIKTGNGTGDIYVDSIELQDTENALTELPKGALVVNTIEGMSDDNRLTPVEKNYLVTLMSEIIAGYGDEDGTPVVGIYYAGLQAGVSSTLLNAFSTKYHALYDAMYGVGGWLTTLTDITTIDGEVFDTLFDDYYAAKNAVEQETNRLNTASLVLTADTTVISVSARGELKTQQVAFSLEGRNVVFTDVEWTRSDYGDPEDGFEFVYDSLGNIDYTKRYIDARTVLVDTLTVTVTYSLGSRTLTSMLALAKVLDGTAGPLYLGVSSTIPMVTEEGRLIAKDFFLYTGDYIGVNTPPDPEVVPEDGIDVAQAQNNEFIKGRMYRYQTRNTYTCTVPQTAASSIILSNTDIDLFPEGMEVVINGETTRRTITEVAAYDTSNMTVALSGGVFDSTVGQEVYLDVWAESRDSGDLALASKDALEISRNTNDWIYAAVVIAQLGLFQDLLVEGTLNSTNYEEYTEADRVTDPLDPNFGKIMGDDGKEHVLNEPKKGFLLDGPKDIIKAYAMEAYNSKIFGSVESTGFKTIEGSDETTIPVEEIPQTLYKYSDMTDLIPDQETFAMVSGTVEGFSFDRLTKRFNTRILMGSHGYESETISAQEAHIFTKLDPDRFFGNTFYYAVSGYYSGIMSKRTLFRMSADTILDMSMNTNSWILVQGSAEGIRAFGENYSGTGTVSLTSVYTRLAMAHGSYAFWGSKSSHVDYLKMYTDRTFNGFVLRNGNTSFLERGLQPNAYYPNTKTFTIGSNTQATLAKHYVSGTDFYNLFSDLPDLADGYLSAGKIQVRTVGGSTTEYACTRLVKDGTGINFYTGSGIVRIDKFNEGTSQGVYEYLKISEAMVFQPVPDGIEVKSILPWGTLAGSTENVSVGTVDSRFESAYFKYLDVLTSARLRGTLQVDGSASVASINTGGLGKFLIGQNLRTTDAVSFASVNTGYGANEVFKISKETLAFGIVGGEGSDTVTKQISAMDIDEIRFVNTTGTMSSSTQNDYQATLKAPAGGTYLIIGAVVSPNYGTPVQTGGFLFSGGSTIWSIGEESDDPRSLNTAFIIRKLTS